LLATVISWEITKVQFVKTADSVFIPKALKLPFMLGTIGILYGRSDKMILSFSRVKDGTDNKGIYNTCNCSGIIHSIVKMFNTTL
jgi:Na+/H+ antiporter NhaD/arsenite permease-like protein